MLSKRRKVLTAFMVLLVFLLAGPGGALAATIKSGDAITISAGEMVEDDVYLFGDVVTIGGHVRGDTIVFCREANIEGTIEGSLLVFAETIRIDGDVIGTARGGANTVLLTGKVSRDLMMAANTISINGEVGQDLFGAANSIRVTGPVGRNILASMSRLLIDAPVGGNIDAYTSELVIGPGAKISGRTTYTSGAEATVDSNAVIGGQLQRIDPPREERVTSPGRALWSFMRPVLSLLALALLMILVFPGLTTGAARVIGTKPGRSAGYGALIVFLAPVAALIGLVTIIGMPISFLSMLLYIVLLYTSRVFAGYFLASLFFQRVNKEPHPIWIALLGMLVLALLTKVPFIGWLINLAAVVFASGALVLYLHKKDGQEVKPDVTTQG